MKGFLSYLILWNLKSRPKNGAEIAKDLERRKGVRPNPGTIYPALKELKQKGLIKSDKNKVYSLTQKGEKEIKLACRNFCEIFYDMKDMFSCCK